MTTQNPTNRICEYYFNDIIKNNRIKNYTTSRYDLSSVNVGNGSNTIQPFKTTISNISTYAIKQILAQVADSSTNYCYYVNDSTTIKTLGNASSFSVSFWAYNNSFDSSFGILFAISDTSNNFISVSQKFNASTNSNIIINIGNTSAYQSHTRDFSPGTLNAYNHYLIMYNYLSETNIQITLYVNGVQINNLGTGTNNFIGTSGIATNITNSVTGFTSTTPIFNGNASLYILGGPLNTSLTYPNGGTASNGAATSISNFIIYIPVTPTEINYLYNNIVPVSLYTNNYTFYSKNSYNINNTKLLYYYPLTTDFSDYKTGTAVINTTVSPNITFGTSSIAAVDPNIKFINGYANFLYNTSGGIQIPSTLINPGGITIAFWAKFNDIVNYENQRLFECYNSSTDIVNKFLSIFTTSNRIYISTQASNALPITNYSLLNNADWHHYCFIISSAGVWTLYVDGVSYTTQFTNHYPVSALYLKCTIGSTYVFDNTSQGLAQTPKETFITQFVLFNRAITPTELSYLVNYPSQVTFSSAATQFTPKAKYVTVGHSVSNPLNRATSISYLPEGGNISTDWVPVISVMNYARISYYISNNINYRSSYDITGYVSNNGKVWVAGINYETGGYAVIPDESANVSLLYSYDAVNWIPVVNSRNILSTIRGIEYGNNMFVVVGTTTTNAQTIAYSYDGIIWTNANINDVFSNISTINSINYKNSIWIASGVSSSTSNKLMATSTNGISWTGITIASLLNKEIADIDYNGSIWVAVGLSDPSANSNIIYSPDFTNWYGVPNPSTSNFGTKGTSIKWGNGKFIAVGHGTKNRNVIKTSTDGVNWTNITTIPETPTNLASNTVSSVNYDPYSSIWFITNVEPLNPNRSLIYTTDNGVTWNNTNVNDGPYEGYSFSYLFQEPPPCFLEGSKILKFDPISEKESYVPVETLRKGDLIKTFMSGYKPISHIGCRILVNPAETLDIRDRLYSLSAKQLNPDSEFDEPLYLTGRHSVLHRNLSQKQITVLKKYMGNIYETENHYRVPIFLDARAKRSTDNKNVIIWHFALEHPDRQQNYGVYANGILVESSSAEYMTEHSNMDLLD
jgi:hypothetical protein